MNDRGSNGTGSLRIEVMTDTAKLTNVIVTDFGKRDLIWSEKVRCSSKIKPRFRAEWEVSSEEFMTIVNAICIVICYMRYNTQNEDNFMIYLLKQLTNVSHLIMIVI